MKAPLTCRQKAFSLWSPLFIFLIVGGDFFPIEAADPGSNAKVDFVQDIQPILSTKCYSCHGEKKEEGGLRWDVKQLALKGGEHGTEIVPGNSAGSRIIQLVAEVKPGDFMPKKGERLTLEQIGTLRAWIDQGAVWPDGADTVKYVDKREHWAFRLAAPPAEPDVKKKGWVRNPIDSFVLERLEKEELQPSAEADKTTLIRRLSLDLVGLPPTIEEVDAFLGDQSAEAYEKLVDRLLASEHYGERWGRYWLDAARYADTNGYEKDQPRTIWPYRDWVIRALNQDLPFDRFTIAQLAGDLLPHPTQDQIVATGFLRNSMYNEEGGVDPEQFRVDSIIDRVDTIGKAFLGLTISCAQCHNHKYDPISQSEYYQFFAFVNNDDEPDFEVLTAEKSEKRREISEKVEALELAAMAKDTGLSDRMAEWEAGSGASSGDWQVLAPDDWHGQPGIKLEHMSDHSLIALAHNPGDATYVVTFSPALSNITALRLEAIPHPNQRYGGPGRSATGNFVLSELIATLATNRDDESLTNKLVLQNPSADFEQKDFSVKAAIDGITTNKTGWAIDSHPSQRGLPHQAVFELDAPLTVPTNLVLRLKLEQKYGGEHTLGRFRVSATTVAHPPKADPVPPNVRRVMAKPANERTEAEKRVIFSYYRTTDTNFAGLNKSIDEALQAWPTGPRTLVLTKRMEDPRTTHIFRRGDFKKPTVPVKPGVPAFLHALPEDPEPSRLTLAKWIVDGKNPLTPRVIMNRFWQAYFGQGLVLTAEDFGTRADAPSHPELLDWLATEFIRQGWSQKAMHRLIVTSASYRQSSRITPELHEKDPYNRLLAHGPRLRVEAEVIRDIALSAGGLLSSKVGGPSIYPPIPDGVLSLGYGSPMKWEISPKEEKYRRGLYVFWKRSVPYPGLLVFDAPNADIGCVRRVKSNTPLQALTTLNDSVFHEAAQAMALRVWTQGGRSDRDRAIYGFRLCTGRVPTEQELKPILALLDEQKEYFENRTSAAVRVSSQNMTNPPPEVNLHRVAAWTMVSRVLLNLDETMTKE